MKKQPDSNVSSCFHNIDAYFVNISITLSDKAKLDLCLVFVLRLTT